MKEWQKQKLHKLLDTGTTLNRHSWIALMVGGAFVLGGAYFADHFAMWGGLLLVAASVVMMFATDIILWYVKWRKRTWK